MSFRFKQFYIDDSRCAMKVGTDGVLLGAWADMLPSVHQVRVLDVGTGSGLIAMMLAQRMPNAMIVGIEIDKEATVQAMENFKTTPWAGRLQAECISLQEYECTNNQATGNNSEKFDLIVSNPPYFNNSLKTPDEARTTARHTDSLSLRELIIHAAALLKENGIFCVILPTWEENNIRQFASEFGMKLNRLCRVHGRVNKPAKRTLLSFRKQQEERSNKNPIVEEYLILETNQNQRSEDYARLTKDFYL